MPAKKASGIRDTKYKLLNTKYCKSAGFTLIELLVAVSIIGILAVLTITSFGNAQEKARDSVRKSDFEEIRKALEIAKSDCHSAAYYPALNGNADFAAVKTYLEANNYMVSVPDDPKTSPGYVYTHTASTPDNNACLTDGTTQFDGAFDYSLKATLENKADLDAKSSWLKCGGGTDNNKPGISGTGTIHVSGQYFVCSQ